MILIKDTINIAKNKPLPLFDATKSNYLCQSVHINLSHMSHYKNVPFKIPESWEWIRLEELLTLLSGQDFPPHKYNDEGIGTPYITGASNIENEKLIINRWTETPSVHSVYGDILVVCKGSGVGKIAMNHVGNVHIARQIQAIRDETKLIENDYIKFCIYSNISDIISKANGLIPGLKRELLLSLFLPIPPLQEQKRIVKEVNNCLALLALIKENTSDLHDVLRKTRCRVLDLAIRGKLVPQKSSDEPAVELLKRINPNIETTCDNPHYPFDIPQNWCWVKLGTLCSFLSRGKSPKYSEERKYPVFAQKCNLYNGDISLEQARFLDPNTLSKWDDKYKLQEGDVLMNSTGTGTVGRTRVFHSDCLGTYPFVVPDSHVSVIRTFDCIESKFIHAYLSSKDTQRYLEDNLAGSTNQKELYIGVLDNLLIPLPPQDEQKRIVAEIDRYFKALDRIKESLTA